MDWFTFVVAVVLGGALWFAQRRMVKAAANYGYSLAVAEILARLGTGEDAKQALSSMVDQSAQPGFDARQRAHYADPRYVEQARRQQEGS